MPSQFDSLLDRDEQQQELIPSSQIPTVAVVKGEREGIYTAERFFHRDKKRYIECVSLLAEGMGQKSVAAELNMSIHTVRAVLKREARRIATGKATVAAQYSYAAQGLLDRVYEDLADDDKMSKTSVVAKMTGAAIATDKAQLLSGGPTARVEITEHAPGEDDFAQYKAELEAAQEARTIDVTEDVHRQLTGREGETPPVKETSGDGEPAEAGCGAETGDKQE